jgi:hypothetical protein
MYSKVRLVIPYAPALSSRATQVSGERHAVSAHNRMAKKNRLGVLDNSKGNADHLLAMVVKGIQLKMDFSSVVYKRKPHVSLPAPDHVLDQLEQEADIVISAMAD